MYRIILGPCLISCPANSLCPAIRDGPTRTRIFTRGCLLGCADVLPVLLSFDKPTVSPLLIPVTSRNILLLPSLPNSIPYRQDNVRRRKDERRVGTAARGSIARLYRLPRRLHADGGSSGRVR